MTAIIYKPAKTAMQSGRAKTHQWVLEYEPSAPKTVEPLMGWTSSSDMKADQLRLKFDSREAAIAYAERHRIPYRVEDLHERRIKPKSYADNFRWQRP